MSRVKYIYESNERIPRRCPDCDTTGDVWEDLETFTDFEGAQWHFYKCRICGWEIRRREVRKRLLEDLR